MPLRDFLRVDELPTEIAVDDELLLSELERLLTELRPKFLDRARSSVVPGPEGIVITLAHLHHPETTIQVEAGGAEIVVSYGEEHVHLAEHEPSAGQVGPLATPGLVPKVIAFLRALLTGRIELRVSHRLLMVTTRSYWINERGERELFLSGGTLWPTLRWTPVPLIRTFDVVGA